MIAWIEKDPKTSGVKGPRTNSYRVATFAMGFIVLLFFSSPYCWGFGLNQHRAITQNAFWFLRPYVTEKITEGNLAIDYPTIDIAGEHFDACSWDDAAENIQNRYHRLDPQNFHYSLSEFGAILHGVQDFYAHSNWLELGLGGRLLVPDSGDWPDLVKWTNVSPYPDNSVFLAQEDEPWSMSGGIRPELTKNGLLIGHALITDSRPWWKGGDDCPDNVEDIEHPQINKDGPTNSQYAGDLSEYPSLHYRAKETAALATLNEFCRLLHYAYSVPQFHGAYPYDGVSRILALWVDEGQNFSGCQYPKEPKNVKMKAEVTSIKMLNGEIKGNWNLVFALYTGDYELSVKKQTETVAINSNEYGQPWPTDKLPSPIVTCVSWPVSSDDVGGSKTTFLTVQGWKDGADPNGRGILGYDDRFFSYKGPTVYRPTDSSDLWPTNDFTISDPGDSTIEVTFRVSFLPTLPGACSGTTNPVTSCVSSHSCVATKGNDIIEGSDQNDNMFGLAGNDKMSGNAGLDDIFGGDGVDNIIGGDGNDTIAGEAGNDALFGGPGSDRITGDNGNDTINGEDGSDILFGSTGTDRMHGGLGNDTLAGQEGSDILYGGDGNDILIGDVNSRGDSPGADIIKGGPGGDKLFQSQYIESSGGEPLKSDSSKDILDCGDGNDEVWVNVNTDHDEFPNCEIAHTG